MKRFLQLAALTTGFALAVTGCSQKTDAKGEMEKAAKALEQAPASQAAVTVAAPPPPRTESAAPAPTPQTQVQATPQMVSQQMNQALVSYKAKEYEDAVTRLLWLRGKVPKTADQAMALQAAIASVVTELGALAAKGDERARAALKQYDKSLN